tara:strand:- start:18 stop:611 length:594 start_codon:yes stop_codon:yes gene_type:complete
MTTKTQRTPITLTDDQKDSAVEFVANYNKTATAIDTASQEQGLTSVSFMEIVSPSLIEIYRRYSQKGTMIGSQKKEARPLNNAIEALFSSVGLEGQKHSLRKRTVRIVATWFRASIALGADCTALSNILANSGTATEAMKKVGELIEKPELTPCQIVQKFIEKLMSDHPLLDVSEIQGMVNTSTAKVQKANLKKVAA